MDSGSLLQPHHFRQLNMDSGINPEVIKERSYHSIAGPEHSPELKTRGFSRSQWTNVPGLMLPLWTTDGRNGLTIYRPDTPRMDAKGQLIKYEIPKGAGVRLDCPPRCHPMLATPSFPLWITEGQKKGNALATHGLC